MQENTQSNKMPVSFWIISSLGLLWNLYGVYQYIGTLRSTPESLQAMGMTAEQAQLYGALPFWMTLAFAVGVFGGVAGCVALLFRHRVATAIFALSLAGYIVLYIGDITEGVFAALGMSQVIVLTVVVIIAAGLLWFSKTVSKY